MSKNTSEKRDTIESRKGTVGNLLDELAVWGFRHSFRIVNGAMTAESAERPYDPAEVKLMGSYRLEGMSDPNEMQIIYAVEVVDGTRGVIIDAFGPYSDPAVGVFMDSVLDGREDASLTSSSLTARELELKSKTKAQESPM